MAARLQRTGLRQHAQTLPAVVLCCALRHGEQKGRLADKRCAGCNVLRDENASPAPGALADVEQAHAALLSRFEPAGGYSKSRRCPRKQQIPQNAVHSCVLRAICCRMLGVNQWLSLHQTICYGGVLLKQRRSCAR